MALTPAFAADTTTYAASVANGVSTITVAATATAVHGTVEITPADADGSTPGHQVALDVGPNTITATVTDRSATGDDYTINVTRLAPRNAGCDTGEDVWCAQLTVGTDSSAGTDGTTGGSLNDDDFRAGSVIRRVVALDWTHAGGDLSFELDSVPAATVYRGWTLEIGDARVSFAGATASASNVFSFPGFYAAASGRTPPAPGSTVFVRLTRSLVGADCETNDIWCTRLTVGTLGGLDGFSGGSLDDEDFVAGGGNRRVIISLDWERADGDLTFRLDSVPAEAVYRQWTLHIGEDRASFAGLTHSPQIGFYVPRFYGAGSGRTPPASGDTVTVRLTTPGVTTLGALSLTDASGTEVTLDPVFAAATATYMADVAGEVATVTVAPRANDSGAEVAIEPADADTSAEGHQVALNVGANTITVTVTNGTSTAETYTITVTRDVHIVALVSNLGQSEISGGDFNQFDQAQAFTAGDNPGGYTLTAVDVGFASLPGSDTSPISASVWSATAGGQPDTKLIGGDLTNPGSLPDDRTVRFTTSGIDLEMGETYVVVFDATSAQLALSNTRSDTEDAGAASEWSIADGSLYRNVGSTTTTWTTFNDSKRIAVIGYAKAGTSGTEAPGDGLQARFGALPVWHAGMAFETELHFSRAPQVSDEDVRDTLFEVTGGRITGARRLQPGSDRSWRLEVQPAGFDDLTLTLPATADCAAEGAVCTAGGERLETPLSVTVPGPGDRLTARLTGLPDGHDGEPVEAQLGFSHEPAVSLEDVRDTLFEVTGGRITGAQRRTPGSSLRWNLVVQPAGAGELTLTLPATEDCAAPRAVCTPDGRRLARELSVTIPGPTAFSVSDAQVEEAPGAVLTFEVSLNRPARAEARVDVATRDGTATAGSDYTAVAQTLVFAPGETLKTVEVAVLDDAHDEGDETMALLLSNAQGALIDDGEGTGTISNTDAIPKAWLARFGRTVTSQVLDAVEQRLTAPRQAGGRLTVGGQALASWNGDGELVGTDGTAGPGTAAGSGWTGDGEVAGADGSAGAHPAAGAGDGTGRGGAAATDRMAMAAVHDWTAPAGGGTGRGEATGADRMAMAAVHDWLAHAGGGTEHFGAGGLADADRLRSDRFSVAGRAGAAHGHGPRLHTLTDRELLLGSSFEMTAGSAADGRGHGALWGHVTVAGFDGREDALTLDGQVTTGFLGADWAAARWIAGLALGHSLGTGGYRDGDCGAGVRRRRAARAGRRRGRGRRARCCR